MPSSMPATASKAARRASSERSRWHTNEGCSWAARCRAACSVHQPAGRSRREKGWPRRVDGMQRWGAGSKAPQPALSQSDLAGVWHLLRPPFLPHPTPYPRYIRIDGSTPSSKRQSLVNDFQDNEGGPGSLGRDACQACSPQLGLVWQRVGLFAACVAKAETCPT